MVRLLEVLQLTHFLSQLIELFQEFHVILVHGLYELVYALSVVQQLGLEICEDLHLLLFAFGKFWLARGCRHLQLVFDCFIIVY